jgi:molybdopterin/thiamine biosynthesis adenylyltransferase
VIFFHLVIPSMLGKCSLDAGTRGWFGGSGVESEYLAVVRFSQVEEGKSILAPASLRVMDHWAYFNSVSSSKLIPWVSVKPGFSKALANPGGVRIEDLIGWTADGQPPDLLEGALSSLCCLEPIESGGVRVYLLVLWTGSGRVSRGRVEFVPSLPRLSARLDGLRPIQELVEKKVAIVGVGSGGSMAALNLAATGVGKLHVFDKDYLSMDNLFRHACDMRHLGRAKVLAVRDLVGSYDLPAAVEPHEVDVVDSAGSLWDVMDDVDLVLCATDSVTSRRLVNYVCVHTRTPLVMACTFHNARVGEIIRVLPGESACYECTRLILREAGALEESDAETGTAEAPYGLTSGEGSGQGAANQGTRSDVSMVAALLSRVAVMTLLADDPKTERLPRDYMTWGARAETGFPDPFSFERPFSVNWVEMRRRRDCPVCATVGMPPGPEVDEEYEKITAELAAGNSAS